MDNTDPIKKNPNMNEETDPENFSLTPYVSPEVSLDEIEALHVAKGCSGLFPLFKELVRNHISEFWIKLAVLFIFSRDRHKTSWTPQELSTELFWLKEEVRKRVVAQLTRSNWLKFTNNNYYLSPFGRSVLTIVATLGQQEDLQDSLGANISSLNLLEMYQNDPTNTLRMFLNELIRIEEEIRTGLESKSEYIIRRLNRRIRSQFAIAVRSREHLEKIPTDNFQAYRLKQEIHEHLSNFHARLSHVQRIQNDLIARRIMLADKSLTQHDISAFLIDSSVERLAELGRPHIYAPVQVRDMVPALMVYEAEWQIEKERAVPQKRGWSPVEAVPESNDDLLSESRFFHFVGEVDHKLKKGPFPVEQFVPHENWTTSGFRFSMLAVLESGEIPTHIHKASEASTPRIQVVSPEEGIRIPSVLLDDPLSGVKEISRGTVSAAAPRRAD